MMSSIESPISMLIASGLVKGEEVACHGDRRSICLSCSFHQYAASPSSLWPSVVIIQRHNPCTMSARHHGICWHNKSDPRSAGGFHIPVRILSLASDLSTFE
jgi:hypothetical protein